jgi:hypothetical protein
MRTLAWLLLFAILAFGGLWYVRLMLRRSDAGTGVPGTPTSPFPKPLAARGPDVTSWGSVREPHARRIDPSNEANAADIRRILRKARLIWVACGEDVNPQTCTFFVNSLRTDLANQQIGVQVFSEQETLVQSFYVSPSLLPFTDVMLRLIEDGPPDNTYLYVGGFSFDSEAQNENGFQLPRWVEREEGTEAGPLDVDRATSARVLAREFSTFWRTMIQ